MIDSLDTATAITGGAAVLAAGVLALYFRKSSKIPGIETFPGPKPDFLIGNVRQFPLSHWKDAFVAFKEQYGDVTHLALPGGAHILVLNRLEDVEELLIKRANVWSGRADNLLVNDLMDFGWSIIQIQPSAGFYQQRKVFRKVVGPNAIGDYDQVIQKEAEGLIRELTSFTGNPLRPLYDSIGKLITTIAYGESVYKQQGKQLIKLNTEALDLVTYAFGTVWLVNLFPITRFLPPWFPGLSFPKLGQKAKKMLLGIRHMAFGMVKEAIDRGEADFSVVSKYLSDGEFSSGYLRDAMALMYFGAVDTTSTALTNFIYHMLMFPEVQKKIQKELDDVIGRGNTPNMAGIQHAKYLRATWTENLRVLPALPTGVPHVSSADDHWKGRFIPKGTMVLYNTSFLLRDPRLWGKDADQFKPERFLPEFNPRLNEMPDVGSIVFGFGQRICPGRHLAQRNGLIYAAALLSAFDIVPPPGESIPTSVEFNGAQILRPVNLQVHLSPRK